MPPEPETPEDYLRELCERGCRIATETTRPKLLASRLEHELGIICKMGFAGLFPHRLGFRPLRPRAGHPRSAPWLGVRGHRQLRL